MQNSLAFSASPDHSTFDFGPHAVRIILIDSDPWFVASDVAAALGYRDASNAARHLKDHQRGTRNLSTLGGEQKVTIITESGLYKLVLRSRKPEAEEFSDWVTGEVLPSIRKSGAYAKPAVTAERLKMAQTQAALVAAKVHEHVFNTMLEGCDWQFGRWLVAFSHTGGPEVKTVDTDAVVASLQTLTRYIGQSDFMVHDADVAALASACSQRIARHLSPRPASAVA